MQKIAHVGSQAAGFMEQRPWICNKVCGNCSPCRKTAFSRMARWTAYQSRKWK